MAWWLGKGINRELFEYKSLYWVYNQEEGNASTSSTQQLSHVMENLKTIINKKISIRKKN